ncbi:unnamed protein product [Sphagnum balticum]
MRSSCNTSCEKSNNILHAGADAAGVDMPLLGGNLSSSSSSAAAAGSSVIDDAQIISCRGKCSSSLSLYRAAKAAAGAGDDHQFFEASSSRHDVRRSASVSYRTVYPRELQPPPPRSVRHVDRRFREHATTASSSWSGSDTTLSFRVESVRGLTRIVGWPLAAAAMYSELAAAGSAEEEEICTTKGENHAEAEEEEEYDDGTERQRFQQLQDLGVAGNYQVRKKLVHMTNLSQSCRMVESARDQFQWRRASARYGSEGAAVVHGKLRTLSSRATMGSCCNENSVRRCELVFDEMNGGSFELLQSHADHESSTLALSPPARFKRSGGGTHRKRTETSTHCKKRVDHEPEESRTAAAANKLGEEEEEDRVSSEWEITTTVASPRDHRDFAARSSTTSKSQLGAMFGTEGGACPSPESSFPSLAAVPFNWEESPGKPKMKMSAAAATHRSDAYFRSAATRATSKNQEIGSISRRMELESSCGSAAAAALKSRRSSGEQQRPAAAVGERSHRYYDQTGMESKSLESIATGARSSRFLVSQETHIDLVAPAAAKFLTHETTSYLSPFATPPHYAFSSPLSVPFKWEETPGKPKADAAASTPNDLQLPPCLAARVVSAPQQQTRTAAPAIDDSGGGDLRSQYCLTSTQRSLSGTLVAFFFSPCLTGACSRPCPPAPRPRQQAVAIPLLRHSSWSSKVSKSLRHKRIQLWSPRSSSSSVSRSRRHCRSSAGSSPNCQEDQSPQIIKQPKVVYEISHLSKMKYNHSRSAPATFSASRHCSEPAQKPCLQTTSLQLKQESPPWTKSHKKVVRLNSGGVSSHKGEAHGHTHHRAGVGTMMSSSPTSTLFGPEPESLSQTSASNPSLSGYLDALTLPESSTEASCPPSSHASFESLEQQQQHQQEEEEEDQETRRTSLSPRSNGFNIIPDFAARLSAPARVTTARHNLTPLLPFSCTSCTSTSVSHEKLLMSCNGTDQEEEFCPFPPAIANAGSLPSPANTDAPLDSPSPANANAAAWDSAAVDMTSPANANAAAAAAAAVAADMSPLPGNAAALDALLLANADAGLSIAAGLDLSSSFANAAAWDSPSSEAGVDLMEVQNCQALGGCQVLGSTRGTKVHHHRVYFIISMCKVLKRVLFRQKNQKVELKQCYHNDICLMEFAIHEG